MIEKNSLLMMSVYIIQVSCKNVHNGDNDTVQNHKQIIVKNTKLRDRDAINVITLSRILTVINNVFKSINSYN